MRWMRAMPSFDSWRMAVASKSTSGRPRPAMTASGSSRTFSCRRRRWPVSASMLASTKAVGLLISCATPAASMPIDASFSACRRRTSSSRSSVVSRSDRTARPARDGVGAQRVGAARRARGCGRAPRRRRSSRARPPRARRAAPSRRAGRPTAFETSSAPPAPTTHRPSAKVSKVSRRMSRSERTLMGPLTPSSKRSRGRRSSSPSPGVLSSRRDFTDCLPSRPSRWCASVGASAIGGALTGLSVVRSGPCDGLIRWPGVIIARGAPPIKALRVAHRT